MKTRAVETEEQKRKYLFNVDYVLGALAMWAVRQSPYPVPENLQPALEKIQPLLRAPSKEVAAGFFLLEMNMRELEALLDGSFAQVPEIVAWNERKNGNQAPFAVVSRYGGPTPDDDFIDLGALSRNVANTMMWEAEKDRKFDEDFENQWKKEHPDAPLTKALDAADTEPVPRPTLGAEIAHLEEKYALNAALAARTPTRGESE